LFYSKVHHQSSLFRSRLYLDFTGKLIGGIFFSKSLQLNLNIKINKKLKILLKILKNHFYFRCKLLVDIFVIDYLTFLSKCSKYTQERFQLNYNVYSISYNWRLFLNVLVNDQYSVVSVEKLFNNACWLEREAWDMYGIMCLGNLDLRRLLTDYSFKGFPLRKDFPLCGFLELAYDEEIKTILYNTVELAQDYRHFTFKMVWKQA
jgi:NADH-quinone oxidoreductase subunit C